MQIELRHLRTLNALRDASSQAQAAERVHLTQSALSHQIKDLETRLRCTLFIRKTHPVRFTPAGLRLLALSDEVLPLVQAASLDVQRLAVGESGRLLLAIECHSCVDWLLPAMNVYREEWPDVHLDVSNRYHFKPLPALARGDLDLVVTANPVDDRALAYLPLFRYEALVAMAVDHPLASREWLRPQDLASETLISYPVDSARLDLFTRFLDPARARPARVRTAELTTMMIQMVASGRGVCCLPKWALNEYVERGIVVTRSLGEGGVWPDLFAAVRAEQRDLAHLSAFVALAKRNCFDSLVGIVPADEMDGARTASRATE